MAKIRNSIIESANELFARFGYNKTTLTDIAQSVGKVKTAIYYYFKSKEEIFAHIVKVEAERFFKSLVKAVNQQTDPLEKLETYIESRISLMLAISNRYQFLKQEWFELMPLVEKNRETVLLQEIKFIEGIMLEGKENGTIHINSPAFSAVMLVNALKGLEIQMYVTGTLSVEELNLKDIQHFLLYGVIGQPINQQLKT